jgi:hypothetical protein
MLNEKNLGVGVTLFHNWPRISAADLLSGGYISNKVGNVRFT